MKTLNISSVDGLESLVADVVRLKIARTSVAAARDAELARVQKKHQAALTALQDEISHLEQLVQDYCTAHRGELFAEKKSRETSLASFGFETTPPRVETSTRRIKWGDVVDRLLRLEWGHVYVRQPEPKPDKEALLADRERLSPDQCAAAGIQFCQDEQFFIRPKPETAADTVR